MSEKPNIVILDVEMPKLNGWRVCEKIRESGEMGYVPIILILSAYAQPEDVKKGLKLGANKYFAKPFKVKELVQAILGFSDGQA
jgi:two-component system response regulator MprA